ncbi:MAG: hypothetical protein HKL84_10920 [Acidimicrobiaceae bacterium]|nr:hypothetical protein [Acidimicrobiaceae bacterium]
MSTINGSNPTISNTATASGDWSAAAWSDASEKSKRAEVQRAKKEADVSRHTRKEADVSRHGGVAVARSPVPVHAVSLAAKSIVAQGVHQSGAAVIQSTLSQVSIPMGSLTAPVVEFRPSNNGPGGEFVVSAGSGGTFTLTRNVDGTVTIVHYTNSGAYDTTFTTSPFNVPYEGIQLADGVTVGYSVSNGDTLVLIGQNLAYDSSSTGGVLQVFSTTDPTYYITSSGIAFRSGPGVSPSAPTIPRSLKEFDQVQSSGLISLNLGNYTTSTQGGIWDTYKAAQESGSSLDAQPVVQPANMLEAGQIAQELISGKSIQEIAVEPAFSANQEFGAEVNDAFELLGISNRQIANYAQEAAVGQFDFTFLHETKVGSLAEQLLTNALQMRAAVDSGASGNSGTVSSFFANPTQFFASHATDSSIDMAGAINAALGGFDASNRYWNPAWVTKDAMASAFQNPILFGSRVTNGIKLGQNNLKATEVTPQAVVGGALSEKIPDAANVLASIVALPESGWTPQIVTEAFYAAAIISQGLGPDVTAALQNNLSTQNPAQTAASYTAAVNTALNNNGVQNVTAEKIGQTLLAMIGTKVYDTATADNPPGNDNRAYSLVAFFDPASLQAAALGARLSGAIQGTVFGYSSKSPIEVNAYNYVMTRLLPELAQSSAPSDAPSLSPSSSPSAPSIKPPFTQKQVDTFNNGNDAQKSATASLVALWVVASLRWYVAALYKSAAVASHDYASALAVIDGAQSSLASGIQSGRLLTDGTMSYLYTSPQGTTHTYSGPNSLELYINALLNNGFTPSAVINVSIQDLFKSTTSRIVGALNNIGFPALVALVGSTTLRIDRLLNAGKFNLPTLTRAQLTAGILADVGVAVEYLTSANRVAPGPAGLTQLTAATTKIKNWQSSLASYLGLASLVNAAGLPVTTDTGTTNIGKFVNWFLPQAGGVSNVLYGGFNFAQGAVALSNGKPATGALEVVSGSVDFFNGLVQIQRAIPASWGTPWQQIRNFGYTYSPSAQVVTRLVAGSAGLALAILSA